MVKRGIAIVGVTLAAILGSAGGARAGEVTTAAARPPTAAELASARRLFADAIAAEDRGRWTEALSLYERVRAITSSPSLHYHMAVCHEELGRYVEAVNAFELAASAAEARREAALARESRARLDRARARIALVTIIVPGGARGVSIEIDGAPLHAALAGSPVPVNPGERRVVVRAENFARAFDVVVRPSAGQALDVRVDLGAPEAPEHPRAPAATPAPAPRPEAGDRPSLVPAFLAGGAAIALGAGAIATGVAAMDLRDELIEQNRRPTMPEAERYGLRDRGQALAITSTALTGAALVAGGIATYLFWPSSSPASPPPTGRAASPRKASATLAPWIGPDGAGLGVRGAL